MRTAAHVPGASVLPTRLQANHAALQAPPACPRSRPRGCPNLGNQTFTIHAASGAPGSATLFVIGLQAANTPLPTFGATLLVTPLTSVLRFADSQGVASHPSPIPRLAFACGLDLRFRVGVPDPAATGGVAFSSGLQARIGY